MCFETCTVTESAVPTNVHISSRAPGAPAVPSLSSTPLPAPCKEGNRVFTPSLQGHSLLLEDTRTVTCWSLNPPKKEGDGIYPSPSRVMQKQENLLFNHRLLRRRRRTLHARAEGAVSNSRHRIDRSVKDVLGCGGHCILEAHVSWSSRID